MPAKSFYPWCCDVGQASPDTINSIREALTNSKTISRTTFMRHCRMPADRSLPALCECFRSSVRGETIYGYIDSGGWTFLWRSC